MKSIQLKLQNSATILRRRIELQFSIGHFTVVHLVTWALNATKAGGDLALKQTSLLFHLNATS